MCEDLRDGVSERSNSVDLGETSSRIMNEARTIDGCLQKFICSHSNKVAKFVASRMIEQSECCVDIIHRLICENERLKGHVEAYERLIGVLNSIVNEIANGTCEYEIGNGGNH